MSKDTPNSQKAMDEFLPLGCIWKSFSVFPFDKRREMSHRFPKKTAKNLDDVLQKERLVELPPIEYHWLSIQEYSWFKSNPRICKRIQAIRDCTWGAPLHNFNTNRFNEFYQGGQTDAEGRTWEQRLEMFQLTGLM